MSTITINDPQENVAERLGEVKMVFIGGGLAKRSFRPCSGISHDVLLRIEYSPDVMTLAL